MKTRHHSHAWEQIPVLRLLVPFIIGIIFGIYFQEFLLFTGCCLTAFFLLLLAALGRVLKFRLPGPYRGIGYTLVAVLLGYCITFAQTDKNWPGHFETSGYSKKQFEVLVCSDPLGRERSVKCEVELKGIYADTVGKMIPLSGRAMVYLQKSAKAAEVRYGDRLLLNTSFQSVQPPGNPGQFNYKRYLSFHQVYHQSYVPTGQWTILSSENSFTRWVISIQHQIIDLLRQHGLSEGELAIVSALLVGYKHHLSSDQVSAFSSAGAMHVLAVSGLHVGIIYMMLNFALRFLGKSSSQKAFKAFLLLAAIWFYAALTGFSPSVARASTMFSFVIVATHSGRHTSIYNTMAISAFFLLALDPYLIVEVGFQLSYLAVFGIVLLQPGIYSMWQPRNFLLDKVWEVTSVSIAAQLATSPLALLYFHQFPNYFIISNLVVIPAAFFVIPIGMAVLAFAWWKTAADWLGKELYDMVHALNEFVMWIESLPYSLLLGIDIGIQETYLLYAMLVAFFCFSYYRKRVYLNWGMALSACFVSLQVFENHLQKRHREMVIYQVDEASAFDFIAGNDHCFLADSSVLNDPGKIRFNIEHNWWKLGLEEPVGQLPGLFRSGPCLVYMDKVLLLLQDSLKLADVPASVDVLYLDNVQYQSPKLWLEKLHPKTVVGSTKISYKTERIWKRAVGKYPGIAYHSLKNDGAFSLGAREVALHEYVSNKIRKSAGFF